MLVKVVIGTTLVQTEELSVTKTIDSMCDSFQIKLPNTTHFDTNKKISISIDDKLLMTGWINKSGYDTPGDNKLVSHSGRSASQDIIDSRITFVAHDQTLSQLSTTLFSQFAQKFSTAATTKVVKDFSIVAESAFEALNQVAKQQDLIFIENPNGSTSLVEPASFDSTHIHLNASNLSNFRVDEDTSKLFNTIQVKTNPGKDNLEPGANNNYSYTITNADIRPSRKLQVIADKLTNAQACQDRANELSLLSQAQSLTASGLAMGWSDPSNNFWKINSLYTVDKKRMLLSSATFNQTGDNRTTQLNFKGHNG